MAKISQRNGRWFAELREYSDVIRPGEDIRVRMALVPKGEKKATADKVVADKLFSEIVQELEARRRNRSLFGVERQADLGPYAEYHLKQKAKDGETTDLWLTQAEKHLTAACAFFGERTDLASLSPEDFTRWVEHLRRQKNGRGGTLSETSVRKYLNSVSNLFKRAVSERYVPSNPVGDMYSKPTEKRQEAPFLTAPEAALLLESARTYQPNTGGGQPARWGGIRPDPFLWMYPLLATFLLTGARRAEVLGLEVDDVSLRHNKIWIRPNRWRRLKTSGSKRTVPLWPQLKEILQAYLLERERAGGLGSLLFPSGRGPEERMVQDVRKAMDRIGARAGFPEGYVRLHMLRHTYTSARVQTCDRGRPVALYTVARELGHRSTNMLEDRYGHLHDRVEEGEAEVVEFRAEVHRSELPERFEALEAVP